METGVRAPRVRRHSSFFTKRTMVCPSQSDRCSVDMQMLNFCHELKKVCQLRNPAEIMYSSYPGNMLPSRERDEQFEWTQSPDQNQTLQELQFQLFINEIQKINPRLKDSCLFVAGLYKLVCSRSSAGSNITLLHKSARNLLTTHTSGKPLLQVYWKRPAGDDPNEIEAYLTVAASFVDYVLDMWGPEGVTEFLLTLDDSVVDPEAVKFEFRGKDIPSLERKWRKFVQTRKKFHLSTCRMLLVLFRAHLLSHWLQIFIVLFIAVADVGLHLYFSSALAQLVSFGIGKTSVFQIIKWMGIILLLIAVHFIFKSVSITVESLTAVRVSNNLQKQLSMQLHEVTSKFFHDHPPNSITSTFVNDVNSIEVVITYSLHAVLCGVLMLVALIVYTSIHVWPIGLSLCVFIIASRFFLYFVVKKYGSHLFAKEQDVDRFTRVLTEVIDGFKVNAVYRLGHYWQARLDDIIQTHLSRNAWYSLFFTKWLLLFQHVVPAVTITLLFSALALAVQKDWLGYETSLTIFFFYFFVAVSMRQALVAVLQIQEGMFALERIDAFLKYPRQERAPMEEEEHRVTNLPVELSGVSFCYEESASHWTLHDVSLRINPGERVAIVGPKGSGKSTLLSLVLQMNLPVQGHVRVGCNGSRHGEVAATFKSNHIFNVSLRENIRFGRLAASDEEVEEAAKLADVHTWIMSRPHGYKTVVHSGDKHMSAGIRQKIAIARMLVANAPVLVLDEVTSSLDPGTGSQVFEQLMAVTVGKTVLAVPDSLSQAKEFDRIFVLSHGRLKESGTHNQLLALQGTYWSMWNSPRPLDNPTVQWNYSVLEPHQPCATPNVSIIGRSPIQIERVTSTPILHPPPKPLRTCMGKELPRVQVDSPTDIDQSMLSSMTPIATKLTPHGQKSRTTPLPCRNAPSKDLDETWSMTPVSVPIDVSFLKPSLTAQPYASSSVARKTFTCQSRLPPATDTCQPPNSLPKGHTPLDSTVVVATRKECSQRSRDTLDSTVVVATRKEWGQRLRDTLDSTVVVATRKEWGQRSHDREQGKSTNLTNYNV